MTDRDVRRENSRESVLLARFNGDKDDDDDDQI